MPIGHDVAFYNAVVALEPRVSGPDILAAIAWVESRGLVPSVHLAAGNGALGAELERHGFGAEDSATVMALSPIPDRLDLNLPAATVLRTGGEELAEEWFVALEAGDGFRRLFSAELVSDPAVRIAVAELDGDPVAGAMAIRSTGGVLGVFAVATVERARRKGLGRAVTWAVIRAGVEAWRSRIAVLEATPMGLPVYQRMGFTDIGSVAVLTRTAASPADPGATR
jgi:GNAT superfamily N-acetyltransferase